MLNFQYPELKDREWLTPILSGTGHMGSENAFGTLYIWRETYHSKVCRWDDCLFLCSGQDADCVYTFPIAFGDLRMALQRMMEDAIERNIPFKMWGMTQREVEMMNAVMPDTFHFEPDRDSSDYIYSTEDMIQLPGRKYHSKRNHLSQFSRKYQFTYEDITEANLSDCQQVAQEWCRENGCSEENGLDRESCALGKAFRYFRELHFSGGLIRIDGKPVAFTIGEEINHKTFLLHFEKALSGYNGLYAAINHEFATHHLAEYEYVNREEDLGIEGLRKAKLSYHPSILLQRYRAVLEKE